MKRLVDIVLAGLALLLLSPVLLATAAAVAIDSGFPVLFRQVRIGRGGTTFGMYKFRSMVRNAAALGPFNTAADDPRITRVGRFIRRTSLDELPQLLNVLFGDMSLVGPRPDVPVQRSLYSDADFAERCKRPPRHHRLGAGAAAFRRHRGPAPRTGPALRARTQPLAGPEDHGLDPGPPHRPRGATEDVRHLRLLGPPAACAFR